jgi:hypothetical protein
MNPSNGKAGALASAGPIPKNDPTEVLVGDPDGIKDVEPELPVEVADSILSWSRVISQARSENLPGILGNAARDLFGTRDKVTSSDTHAVVTQAIGDALVDWAQAAGIDDDDAQRIFAEAAAAADADPVLEIGKGRIRTSANGTPATTPNCHHHAVGCSPISSAGSS